MRVADETGELVAEVHAGVGGAACARAMLWRGGDFLNVSGTER